MPAFSTSCFKPQNHKLLSARQKGLGFNLGSSGEGLELRVFFLGFRVVWGNRGGLYRDDLHQNGNHCLGFSV